MAVIVMVMFVLAVPLLIKWHHPGLVLAWNSTIAFTFMPGRKVRVPFCLTSRREKPMAQIHEPAG